MATKIVTSFYRILNAVGLYNSVTDGDSNYYITVGKIDEWADEDNPDAVTNYETTSHTFWKNMLAGKKITSSEVSHVVRRIDWTTSTVYDPYDPSVDLLDGNYDFYVMTDEYKVYKCIDNNNGAASTTKPTSTSLSIITTADGYRWKFLYQLNVAERTNILTTNWMPVKFLTVDDTSLQWDVQAAATVGTIEKIKVNDGGSGYTSTPTVFIEGDGSGATATATVVAGQITQFTITSPGSGYTRATVTLSGGSPSTEADIDAVISPSGGHGSNPVYELGGFNILIKVNLDASESGNITVDNDFRQVAVLVDPIAYGTTDLLTSSIFDQTFKINIDAGYTGTFVTDEVVTGDTSNATGIVVDWDTSTKVLRVLKTSDNAFEVETISGGSGSGTIISVDNPDVKINSGRMMYLENRTAITRSSDQTEDIRIVLKY